jgi:hypothetical protein
MVRDNSQKGTVSHPSPFLCLESILMLEYTTFLLFIMRLTHCGLLFIDTSETDPPFSPSMQKSIGRIAFLLAANTPDQTFPFPFNDPPAKVSTNERENTKSNLRRH